MKKIIATLVIASFGLFAGQAFAASDCEAKAVDKNGKALSGAAKTSSIKKCEAGAGAPSASAACEAKAVDKNGKPLAGAAKTSSIKKCESAAAASGAKK